MIDQTWSSAANAPLSYDFTYRRKANTPTIIFVAIHKAKLYVGFKVTQSDHLTANTETNGPAVLNDDYVGIYLFPQGTQGFQYAFFSNTRSAHYQYSSENTTYFPEWFSAATVTATGYVVTLCIPLNVIRANGSRRWRAQFVRYDVSTGELSIWAHNPRQSGATQAAFAGVLEGVTTSGSSAPWPKSRVQPYVLGQLAPSSQGGTTSRVGLDVAVPITPTASILAALHPDYSNVEVDQQTIVPSAFPYQYVEVRPFFTQSANAFNYHAACLGCPQTLYTPSIPTFSQGYAVEGAAGMLDFGAFAALSPQRTDQGQALDYTDSTSDQLINIDVQRVSANLQGVSDDSVTLSTGYTNRHSHLFFYDNVGSDDASTTPTGADNRYNETGFGFGDATSTAMVSYLHVGRYFSPVDGYVAQTDISGFEGYLSKVWSFAPSNILQSATASEFFATFTNSQGKPDQTQQIGGLTFNFKNFLSASLNSGAVAVQAVDTGLLPFFSNSLTVSYRANTSTPSYVEYTAGPYYRGTLKAWTYVATVPLSRRIDLSLQAFENQYSDNTDRSGTQWLERAALNWQFSPSASFTFGARRIIGLTVPNSYEAPPFPFVDASNVSAAFHYLSGHNELYLAYGDPNSLSTAPQTILKWILYIGAEKGT